MPQELINWEDSVSVSVAEVESSLRRLVDQAGARFDELQVRALAEHVAELLGDLDGSPRLDPADSFGGYPALPQ